MSKSKCQMVATAICPDCKEPFFLRTWPSQPALESFALPEIDPVTFVCCGKSQSVPAASIQLKLTNVIEMRS